MEFLQERTGLAEELRRQGRKTSHRMVEELLHELGYRWHDPDFQAEFEFVVGDVVQPASGDEVLHVFKDMAGMDPDARAILINLIGEP